MTKKTIGFIGLGAMGEPMVERLLDANFSVTACVNRNREPVDRLSPKGLVELSDPYEVGLRSDVLMCCVFDEEQNDQVLRGDRGALSAMRGGSAILLMSTISPDYCQNLAKEAATKGIRVLDCPLSGRVQGALDGTLTLMIGGSKSDVAECGDVLAPLGTVMRCGELGSGQVMKLANNAIVLTTFSLLLEVREMVATYGMDLDTFMSILNQSTGRSHVSEGFPMPKGRLKMVGMPAKDVSTCLRLAEKLEVSLPVVQECYKAGLAEAEK